MATTEGRVDVEAAAQTVTTLGWLHRDGSPVEVGEVYDVWNELWGVLGNVGDSVGAYRSDRIMSPAACVLVHDALFEEVPLR